VVGVVEVRRVSVAGSVVAVDYLCLAVLAIELVSRLFTWIEVVVELELELEPSLCRALLGFAYTLGPC
jgi:hypothetical protein